jgi:hypothetical protein
MPRQLALATLAAIAALGSIGTMHTATAAPMQDSYCLQGRQSGYPGNCEFSTYQQCMATASGTNEGCGVNPMKAYNQQRRSAQQGRYYR